MAGAGRLGAAAVVVAFGCAARAPAGRLPEPDEIAGAATDCAGAPSQWVDQAEGRDRVRLSEALPADAERAGASLAEARRALAEELGVPSAETAPVLLWLPTASERIRRGSAMTMSDASSATVFLPSPSCAPDTFDKTLVHELSGEYLAAATRRRGDGWAFYSGSPWFVQGAEVWVTRLVHERPADRAAAARARALRSPDGAVRAEGGQVVVQEVYRDGEALVAWIVLTYGEDVLSRLLASRAPSFDAALAEVVQLDGPGLVDAYHRWRAAPDAPVLVPTP